MKRLLLFSAALLAGIALAGCGVASSTAPKSVSATGNTITGKAMGGQQSIANASVVLWAASGSGYGTASTQLISTSTVTVGSTTPVYTDSTGSFSINTDYTCPTAGTQVYLTITGGNPVGSSTNANIGLMAALGSCGNLMTSTFVDVNEVTTVASVWALSPFMTAYDHVGTSSNNSLGLTNAFATVNELVNISTGLPVNTTLPAGATVSTDEIYALANILASCVNSTGSSGPSDTTSNCGQLFTYTTVGTEPTNTIDAAMRIAQYPTNNVSGLFGLINAVGAAFTTNETQPTSWTIAVNYTGGGLSQPTAIASDQSGNVWAANTNNSVTKLGPTGAAISSSSGYTGGSMNIPYAIAIDTSGNAWVANSNANYITYISSNGSTVTGYTNNGLNKPKGIAIDSLGDIWAANSGTNYISEFTSTGTAITYYTGGGLSKPIALAINPH